MSELSTLYSRNIDVNLAYKPIGDWGKARLLLQDLPYQIMHSVKKGQKSFAKIYFKAIKAKIKANGGGDWAALSKAYARAKIRDGGNSGDIMHWYGDYQRAIRIQDTDRGVIVGITKGIKHSVLNSERDVTIAEYAKVLEHGSFWHDIPARPLWSSVFKDLGGKRRVLREVTMGIKESILKRYGINITSTIR